MGLCWGSVERASLEDLIGLAGANGFAAIQVRPGLYFDARARGRADADLRRLLHDQGVRVDLIDTFGPRLPGVVPPPQLRPQDRAGFTMTEEEGFRVAEALEARTVNLPHYCGDPETPLKQIADAFCEFCERATRRGFNTSLEFIPGTGVAHLGAALEVVRDASNAGVLLDVWHWSRANGTLGEVMALRATDLAAVQISDRTFAHMTSREPYQSMTGRAQPGYGDLPLVEILSQVFSLHPDMCVGVEVFSAEQRAYSSSEAARVCAVALGRLLERVDSIQCRSEPTRPVRER
jgi:sugar phosphate isomerase/epimerase